VATSPVQAGDFVTVIDPEPPPPGLGPTAHLSTFAGVKPGDHLFVDVPVQAAAGAPVTFTINVPNEEQGYNYTLHSTCGTQFIGRGNSPVRATTSQRARRVARKAPSVLVDPVSASVTLNGCGGTADLLVVGEDGETGLHSWQYLPAVALTEGGTVNVTGYQSATVLDFHYTALPGTQQVDVTRELRTSRGLLFSASGTGFFDGNSGGTQIPMPTPDGVVAVTTSTDVLFTAFSRPTIIAWGDNTDYTLDIQATALHAYTDAPSFDPATHAVTWPSDVDGQVPQLTLTGVQAARSDGDGNHTWTWDLLAPWTEGSAVYPVLPTTLFDFNPSLGDEPFVNRLTTATVPGGYDAARPRVFAGDLAGGVAGATGQIVVEDKLVNVALRAGGAGKRPAARSLRREGLSPRVR
jgi:hypothetical protein